ncbi:MAG: hypothetical protein Q9225_002718 [Loekoesia sp. 1 TL-2023]
MAKLPPPQPAVVTARPPITLSPFEELLLGAEKPTSMIIHLYHSRFLNTNPADHLLTVLPHCSILTLRAVSHTTKDWVEDNYLGLLKRLRVTCPLPRFTLQWNSTLRRLSHDCEHLTINVEPSPTPIPTGTLLNPTPAGQIFNIVYKFLSLRIVPPPRDAFEPLLSLRLTLESISLRSLTAIHIEPLDIASLLALRWGGFDSFTDSTWIGQSFWRGLKSLRIGMTSDWLEYAHSNLQSEQDLEMKMKLKEERELYRQGIQVLHNYLFQFSLQDTLETLRFDWVGGNKIGPNPLLLDEEVAKEGGKWFSAPGLIWKGLKEVWLGGVRLYGVDVAIMKERLEELKKMMVWECLAAAEISGKVEVIEGKEWFDIDLKTNPQEPWDFGEVEDLFDTDDEGGCDRGDSMVVPFMLKI